jgi:hypothetical protein
MMMMDKTHFSCCQQQIMFISVRNLLHGNILDGHAIHLRVGTDQNLSAKTAGMESRR